MQVYIDRLPDTKSEKGRGFTFYKFDTDHSDGFTHTVGTLTIESPGHRIEYLVDEFPTGWDGRGFHLAKLCGAIGDTSPHDTAYDVFVCRNGQDCRCDCKGFTYGRGKPCKHIAAVKSCIEQGWL